jgi:hypothetical protein
MEDKKTIKMLNKIAKKLFPWIKITFYQGNYKRRAIFYATIGIVSDIAFDSEEIRGVAQVNDLIKTRINDALWSIKGITEESINQEVTIPIEEQ